MLRAPLIANDLEDHERPISLLHGDTVALGLYIFTSAFILNNFVYEAQTEIEYVPPTKYEDASGAVSLTYAVMQTCGLTLMTLNSTIEFDFNLYWQFNQRGLKLFVGLGFTTAAVTGAIGNLPNGIGTALPFVYLAFRFEQIANQHEGYIRVSTFIVLILMTVMIGLGLASFLTPAPIRSRLAVAAYDFLCPCVIWSAYRCPPWHAGSSETFRFNIALWAFLFAMGSSNIFQVLYNKIVYNLPILWIWGPMHMVSGLQV
jgi:hypothetical protein